MKKSELQQLIREEIQHTLKERRNPYIVDKSLNLLDKAADYAIKNPTVNIVALGKIIKRYVDDIRKSL
jgi:Pyruvate/2-oxoacid:ferredoxin oxidoreductase gamma subunit